MNLNNPNNNSSQDEMTKFNKISWIVNTIGIGFLAILLAIVYFQITKTQFTILESLGYFAAIVAFLILMYFLYQLFTIKKVRIPTYGYILIIIFTGVLSIFVTFTIFDLARALLKKFMKIKEKIDFSILDNLFNSPQKLTVGNYQAMLKLDTGPSYRLHLRIDNEGGGLLIINASTILHLNATAVEYAWHLIKQTPEETALAEIMKRYRVDSYTASQDFANFKERLETLVSTPDLDPETFLDFERVDLHNQASTAPMRLDCALTYQVPAGSSSSYAPVDRVKRLLDTDEWKQILKNAWDAGIPHVIFTGGEPTLRPDVPELIRFAEELGQVSGLITDGSRLTETNYLHELLMAGLDHLMVVFNPASEQSWEAVKDAINEDIFLTVHLTLTDKNKVEFEKTLKRLSDLKVKSLSLSAESSELWKILPQYTQKAVEAGFSLVWDLPVPYCEFNPISLELELGETRSNGAGKTWLYVEPDGDVLPGQGYPTVLGNLLTDPWMKIWAEAKIVKYG